MPKYYIAAQTGLSYMQYWLNNILEFKGQSIVEEWYWPKLFSCPDNQYFSVFARGLYYTEQRMLSSNMDFHDPK